MIGGWNAQDVCLLSKKQGTWKICQSKTTEKDIFGQHSVKHSLRWNQVRWQLSSRHGEGHLFLSPFIAHFLCSILLLPILFVFLFFRFFLSTSCFSFEKISAWEMEYAHSIIQSTLRLSSKQVKNLTSRMSILTKIAFPYPKINLSIYRILKLTRKFFTLSLSQFILFYFI